MPTDTASKASRIAISATHPVIVLRSVAGGAGSSTQLRGLNPVMMILLMRLLRLWLTPLPRGTRRPRPPRSRTVPARDPSRASNVQASSFRAGNRGPGPPPPAGSARQDTTHDGCLEEPRSSAARSTSCVRPAFVRRRACTQVLDRRPHLVTVPRRPVVTGRQPRNPPAPANGDQPDHETVVNHAVRTRPETASSRQLREVRSRP